MLERNPIVLKTLLYRFVLIALFFLFVLLTKTSAQVNYSLEPFDGISVTGNIEVLLQQGDSPQAELEADGIPEDKVTVRVDRGVLKLRVLDGFFYKHEEVKVVVTYTKLNAVKAYAGAFIESDGRIEAEKFVARAASGARVELELQVESIKANASEGGRLILEGETDMQDVVASTGGQYDGLDLECNRTFVRANTGGQADVVANELLDASANTGGQVEYRGNPEEKNTRIIIAGSVRKI